MADRRLYNVLVLGFAFMCIFTAFQTCSMVEKTVLTSLKDFSGSAYISLGIVYAVFSVSNWAAPSFVSFVGPRPSMFFGSIMYFLFVLQFLKPMVWALYLTSALVGFGAAILWAAQGNFLTINSDSETVARNSGIFWALLQCSLLIGNMYSYFVFQGKSSISESERTKLFIALSAAGLAGTLLLLLLRRPLRAVEEDEQVNINASTSTLPDGPLVALKRSFELLRTREMFLLCFTFAYTGVHLTFFSGVYGACISNTQKFGSSANGLLGISGILIGVGEILGGALFGLFGKRTNTYGRDPIIILGYVLHMVAFFLIFINLPDNSPIEPSLHATYIPPNQYLAIFCSFLLGFGDSSFNTQIFSLLGYMYPDDSAPAFALFKFFQSVTAAAAFYYSNELILQWQLLILVVVGTVGSYTFSLVEWRVSKASRSGYQTI